MNNDPSRDLQIDSVKQAATTHDFQLESVMQAATTHDSQLESVMQSLHSYRQQALLYLDAGLAETENSTISMTDLIRISHTNDLVVFKTHVSISDN